MPKGKKPLVIVTRKLPDSVETRMRELFDTRLNLEDKPMTQAQLGEALKAADVLVPTVTDRIDAPVLKEAGPHLNRTLKQIRKLGAKAGVVFNPSTDPSVIQWMMEDVDLVLVMSINPGFGGQTFMHSQLAKIAALRKMIDATGRDIPLEVDGGVTPETAPLCVEAGATALVAGTAVFRGGEAAYAANIRALRGA